MPLQFAEMGYNRGHELTVLDHDDRLNISIPDHFMDQGEVLPLHL
jgi:hypothetical protein